MALPKANCFSIVNRGGPKKILALYQLLFVLLLCVPSKLCAFFIDFLCGRVPKMTGFYLKVNINSGLNLPKSNFGPELIFAKQKIRKPRGRDQAKASMIYVQDVTQIVDDIVEVFKNLGVRPPMGLFLDNAMEKTLRRKSAINYSIPMVWNIYYS